LLQISNESNALAATSARKSKNGKLVHMQGGFLIRHSRLTALGMMLCLLAALFAVEAKIGWFSPAGSGGAQISYAKARPAEPPKILPQHFASPAPPARDFDTTTILATAILLIAAASTLVIRRVPARRQIAESSGFSSALFVRPPPVL
jgi:hypothetical protein